MSLETMVVGIEWKSTDDPNVLEGYASTFGNVDLGGDVVVQGAFKKTIANIKANGIPLLADHVPSTAHVLGTIFDAKEDSTGLRIKARLSKAPSAQDVRTKLLEKHLNRLSIGYETLDEAFEVRDGKRVRLLQEIKLWETSVVVFPMNTEAAITRVKHLSAKLTDEAKRAVAEAVTSTISEDDSAEPESDAAYRESVEQKITASDLRGQLSAALSAMMDGKGYAWLRDWDESHAWYEVELDSLTTWEDGYTVDDKGTVSLEGNPIKVRAVTTYVAVDETDDDATGDEPEAKAANPPADADDEAANSPDEGAQGGWNPWDSRALLAGNEPGETVSDVELAGMIQRLEVLDDAIQEVREKVADGHIDSHDSRRRDLANELDTVSDSLGSQ